LEPIDDVLCRLQHYRLSFAYPSSLTEKNIYDLFPLHQVLAQYQEVGKHFMDERTLAELKTINLIFDGYNGKEFNTGILHCFLKMSLDKYNGYYDYNTYIGTSLLNNISIDFSLSFNEIVSMRISHLILFLCDIALFECRTFLGEDQRLPDQLTSPQNREKRILNIVRAIQKYGDVTDHPILTDEIDRYGKSFLQDGDKIDVFRLLSLVHMLDGLIKQMPTYMQTICAITMEPVWTVHDEYMFIRILQCFEIIFSIIVKGFLTCQGLIQHGDFKRCSSIMRKLNLIFQCNSALFRILNSMPRETFALFRTYTDGASAIQSEQYKLIEALAARPSPSRLYSAAFASVPGVKRTYEQGELLHFEDLLQSYADWENADFLELIQSMGQFDASFVQWKKVHTNIAVKMLGSQLGTGYTQGTPYLKANADARLFPFLQQWEGRSP